MHLKNKIREPQSIVEDSEKLVTHRKNRDTFEAPKRKRKRKTKMTPKIKKFRKSSKKQINWDRGSKSNKNCNKNNKKIFLNVFHQTITI